MKPLNILPALKLKGAVILPGDKSIAHRAVFLSAISCGKTILYNFPFNDDCLATLDIFRELGVKISKANPQRIIISSKGLNSLKPPKRDLFIKESGTTFRLLLGLLAAQKFTVTLKAGRALSSRPMLRVINPLKQMGADITSEYPPITIKGAQLKGIDYKLPVASAQVKSAILLAGLYAKGYTRIIEPAKTRDHTERMLKLFKAPVKTSAGAVSIKGLGELKSPGRIRIPGDLSSAAFFMVAASILPGSKITIKNVSLNPGRVGVIKVLRKMGARIKISRDYKNKSCGFEPSGDIIVKSSRLKGVNVGAKEVPSMIDELPVLMVAGSLAKGRTIFSGVGELRFKETDRISSMIENLKKMGACIRVSKQKGGEEKIIIEGVKKLKGASLKSYGDHRSAMSLIIASLSAEGRSRIDDISCINKSFPGFVPLLASLKQRLP
ncbi:MAG: 3-phosphoshikimate 1-carboxyvinyltransferase [Candidatus Omnitrophica bacterium ADurb.Bin205]|nr:MAG: 3-phosphoshikimate 1-carboxyvinyltransferase [Candidatus Omnitrophica bacterium ADurb.Bin205]